MPIIYYTHLMPFLLLTIMHSFDWDVDFYHGTKRESKAQ